MGPFLVDWEVARARPPADFFPLARAWVPTLQRQET